MGGKAGSCGSGGRTSTRDPAGYGPALVEAAGLSGKQRPASAMCQRARSAPATREPRAGPASRGVKAGRLGGRAGSGWAFEGRGVVMTRVYAARSGSPGTFTDVIGVCFFVF